MADVIESDVQKLDLGSLVDFYTLDTRGIGGFDVLNFHPGVNEMESIVYWQGTPYTKYPVVSHGYELSGKGVLPRPQITVSNIGGIVSMLCKELQDMVGAQVTRRRTLAKYLDAVNFPGGVNPTANPGQHFPNEVWYINRKIAETDTFGQFELTAKWDVTGVKLPRGQMIQNACPWRYRGPECGYTGTAYFTVLDVSTANSALDACGKRLASCKLRFGVHAELPTGAFPGMFRIPQQAQ